MSLAIILGLSVLTLLIVGILKLLIKKDIVAVDIEKVLRKALQDKGYETILKIEAGASPSYDYQLDQIEMREGNTVKHLAECFHEFGHAIDGYNKNIHSKNYDGIFYSLLFYIMKYSVPVGLFLMMLATSGAVDNLALTISSYAFLILAVIFTTATLKEEITATKLALIEIKKHFKLSKKEMKLVKLTLAEGMTSYLALIILAYVGLGLQILYTFVGQYL